jgi:hypothetical protein
VVKGRMMKKSNFDLYLEEQLRDKDFAERFKKAGEGWDIAVQRASLPKVFLLHSLWATVCYSAGFLIY